MEFWMNGACVRVNIPRKSDLLLEVDRHFAVRKGFALATLNLDHLVKLRVDRAFRDAYEEQDFVTADGNPIVWLSRAANRPVELLPGSDLVHPILSLAAKGGVPVAFLGGKEETLVNASAILSEQIPDLEIRACVAPSMKFDPESSEALSILDHLAEQEVGLVLLALGAPKQERLAALGRRRHPGMSFLSIGAGLDFIAGTQRRAPFWVRRMALEWLWRLVLSPRRLAGRYFHCIWIFPGHLLRALALRRCTARDAGPSEA